MKWFSQNVRCFYVHFIKMIIRFLYHINDIKLPLFNFKYVILLHPKLHDLFKFIFKFITLNVNKIDADTNTN